ncbi:dTMP kinase [Pseudomonas sp. MF7453]|uniref:dTMP kinase n=1 Tax=Pseudomonas sp. MF7453 TaxID=2797539 RepID=UPI0018E7938F|nr:dTMP kinase [Pseudomonas sp. MF7453]MBJ2218349.1 thymidylate kinase [Pseudomonas sp. MF7453]
MTRALFVSLDGPKGTGKTTLLEAVTTALRADNKKVVRLCERKSDPYRAQTMALVNKFARDPSRDLELEVCERFADSRSWITRHVLAAQPPDSIILMDRWYPSDAAFRRLIPFKDILALNLDRQVQVPDLHVGVVTTAQISWARAAARRRGLSSTVMFRLEEQVACTEAFERVGVGHGWALCRNEGTVEEGVRWMVSEVHKVLRAQAG